MPNELDPEDVSSAAEEIFRNADPNRDLTEPEKATELPKIRSEFLMLLRQIPAFQGACTDELLKSLEEGRKPVQVNVLLTPGERIDELPERAWFVGLAEDALIVSRKTVITNKPPAIGIEDSTRMLTEHSNSTPPSAGDDSILTDELLVETPRIGRSITYTPGSVETFSPSGESKFKLPTIQCDNTVATRSARQMQQDLRSDFKLSNQ